MDYNMKSFEEFLIEKRISNTAVKKELYQDARFTQQLVWGQITTHELLKALENGYDPNSLESLGNPILWEMAKNTSDNEKIKLLLEYGADIEKPTVAGYSPLMIASMFGSYDNVVTLLQSGADVTFKNKGNTALAVAKGDSIKEYILNYADTHNIPRSKLI